MKNLLRWEILAGIILLLVPAVKAGASQMNNEGEIPADAGYLTGPNILEMMILDDERATPPTPVSGSYLMGLVVNQTLLGSLVQSDVGIQIYLDGERLDPRRYQVEWKVLTRSAAPVRAKFIDSTSIGFAQLLQITVPLNPLHGRLLGDIAIEVRVTDREQADTAPVILVHNLRDLLLNGRDGL
jgi:hypothetical protein